MPKLSVAILTVLLSGTVALADAASDAAKYFALPMEHFRDTATLKDDPLDTIARIDTSKGYEFKHGWLGIVWEDAFLRAFIDKKTGRVTYQVYEIIPYTDTNWHFYQTANYEAPSGPVDVPVTIIDREVSDCSDGSCSYVEHVAFDAPESLLRAIAATYVPGALVAWKFKFNPKAGPDFKDGLSGAEITGCLAAVDAYLSAHRPGGASADAPAGPLHGTAKLGIHGLALSEANSKLFHTSINHGIFVVEVDHLSVGEIAGIKAGDVIVSYQGKPVSSVSDIQGAVAATAIGSTASVEVWRDGAPLKASAKF